MLIKCNGNKYEVNEMDSHYLRTLTLTDIPVEKEGEYVIVDPIFEDSIKLLSINHLQLFKHCNAILNNSNFVEHQPKTVFTVLMNSIGAKVKMFNVIKGDDFPYLDQLMPYEYIIATVKFNDQEFDLELSKSDPNEVLRVNMTEAPSFKVNDDRSFVIFIYSLISSYIERYSISFDEMPLNLIRIFDYSNFDEKYLDLLQLFFDCYNEHFQIEGKPLTMDLFKSKGDSEKRLNINDIMEFNKKFANRPQPIPNRYN